MLLTVKSILRYPNVQVYVLKKAALFMRQFGFQIDGKLMEGPRRRHNVFWKT